MTRILRSLVAKEAAAPQEPAGPLARVAQEKVREIIGELVDPTLEPAFGVRLNEIRDVKPNSHLTEGVKRVDAKTQPRELTLGTLTRLQYALCPVDITPDDSEVPEELSEEQRSTYVKALTDEFFREGADLVATGRNAEGRFIGLLHVLEVRLELEKKKPVDTLGARLVRRHRAEGPGQILRATIDSQSGWARATVALLGNKDEQHLRTPYFVPTAVTLFWSSLGGDRYVISAGEARAGRAAQIGESFWLQMPINGHGDLALVRGVFEREGSLRITSAEAFPANLQATGHRPVLTDPATIYFELP